MDVVRTVTERIDSNDSDILKATKIFDPMAQNTYDITLQEIALEKLVNTYSTFGVDRENIKEEFTLLKVRQ